MLTTDGLTFSTAWMTVREYSSSRAPSSRPEDSDGPIGGRPVAPAASSDTKDTLPRMEAPSGQELRCRDPAQGFGFRLHLSNVLNITKRTSLPPLDRPGRDDSRARP